MTMPLYDFIDIMVLQYEETISGKCPTTPSLIELFLTALTFETKSDLFTESFNFNVPC